VAVRIKRKTDHGTIDYEVDTRGLGGEDTMIFSVGKWHCGDIQDGVSLSICRMKGSWVISTKDFLRIAMMVILGRWESLDIG
jgi:hypothetical protein